MRSNNDHLHLAGRMQRPSYAPTTPERCSSPVGLALLKVYSLPEISKRTEMSHLITSPFSLAPILDYQPSMVHGSASRLFAVFLFLQISFFQITVFENHRPMLSICRRDPVALVGLDVIAMGIL